MMADAPISLEERRRAQSKGEPPVEITDTDLANARRLAARHGEDLRFTVETGWLVWDGRRFAIDEKGVRVQALAKSTAESIFREIGEANEDQRDILMRHAKRSQSKNAIDAMIWLARSEPGICTSFEKFDADPWLFNVANGTLDLRTGTLREHSRADCLTKLSEVSFDPGADSELFDSFLWRITGQSEALYAYMQRLIGYLLSGSTAEQVIAFFYGLGANGKSVLCECLLALLGDYGMTAMPDLVISRRSGGIPNDVAALRGRRGVFLNETSQGSRFDEAKLKHLTGGDTLTGRFLHREFFDFRPAHKLVIRGNHKPAISGTDEGIWRRLHLVPFDVQIPPEEQDRDLLTKILAELPGVLRWAVAGSIEWQRKGLNPPPEVIAAVQDYRQESDTLGRFITEHCETGNLYEVRSMTFFSSYQAFAERAGERWIPQKDLPAELERRGFRWRRTNTGRIFNGIRLRAPDSVNGDGW